MTDNTQKNFYVGSVRTWYESSRYESYAEAEAAARRQAYSEGLPYLIFQAVATAEAPVEVNSVKVTKL